MGLLYDHATRLVRSAFDARLAAPPVLEMGTCFPDGARFVRHWRSIRDEALALAPRLEDIPRFHELMAEQASISANDGRDWRLFVLKAYGARFPRNMAACPTLARLVESSPDVLSAALSFMGPRKHIPAHRGPFRGILRYYLALSMPTLPDGSGAAVLRVDDHAYRLTDGGHLLWDDTFEHEVWNESDAVRTVLLLDVRRRDLPLELQLLSGLVIAVAHIGAIVRARAWR